MKWIFILIILFNLQLFSQNSDTYFSIRISEDLYEYFDSSGVTRMDGPDSCDCLVQLSTKFWQKCEKIYATDSLMLNDFADESIIENLLFSLKREFKKRKFGTNESITAVYVQTTIKRLSNRIHLFSFNRKLRYKIKIDLYYKPV